MKRSLDKREPGILTSLPTWPSWFYETKGRIGNLSFLSNSEILLLLFFLWIDWQAHVDSNNFIYQPSYKELLLIFIISKSFMSRKEHLLPCTSLAAS